MLTKGKFIMKKVLALVLTLIIALSSATVAFAAVEVGECPHCGATGFATEKQLNDHVLECNEQDFFQKLEDLIDIKALVDIYVKVNDFLAKIPVEGIIGFILDAVNGLLTKI